MDPDDDPPTEPLPAALRRSAAARPGRLHARAGHRDVPVLRVWETGFAVAAQDAARIGGRVDLFDGARFLCRALVVAADDAEGERRFEFKFATRATAGPPRADHAPGVTGDPVLDPPRPAPRPPVA